MKVEEWLGLALRVLGVIVLLYGAGYLLDGTLFQLEYFTYPDSSANYYFVVGILYCVVGLFLIRGAPHIVRFAYPNEEEVEEPADTGDETDAAR